MEKKDMKKIKDTSCNTDVMGQGCSDKCYERFWVGKTSKTTSGCWYTDQGVTAKHHLW